MRKLFVLTCALVLAGCGGSGDSVSLENPFAGTWTGTWSAPTLEDGGTVTANIASNGAISGAFDDNGTLAGTINTTGGVDATVSYPEQTTGHLSGNLHYNQQNHLVGTLTETRGEQTFDVDVDLTSGNITPV